MSKPLTAEEIEHIISFFSPHKAPGPDRLTAAFYQHFAVLLAPALLKVYQDFLDGTCSESAHKEFHFGFVVPIPKKVKVIKSFKHIRPISLLNNDYKILSKLLAERMKPHLDNLTHPDQTG